MFSANLCRRYFDREMIEKQKQAPRTKARTGLVFLLSGIVAAFQSLNGICTFLSLFVQ